MKNILSLMICCMMVLGLNQSLSAQQTQKNDRGSLFEMFKKNQAEKKEVKKVEKLEIDSRVAKYVKNEDATPTKKSKVLKKNDQIETRSVEQTPRYRKVKQLPKAKAKKKLERNHLPNQAAENAHKRGDVLRSKKMAKKSTTKVTKFERPATATKVGKAPSKYNNSKAAPARTCGNAKGSCCSSSNGTKAAKGLNGKVQKPNSKSKVCAKTCTKAGTCGGK